MVKVVTIKPHNPDGSHHYAVGDVYTVTERTAKVLLAVGFVTLESEPEGDKKTRYKRRDLRAES